MPQPGATRPGESPLGLTREEGIVKKSSFVWPAALTLLAAGLIVGVNAVPPLANPMLFSTQAPEDGLPQPSFTKIAVEPSPATCLGFISLTFDDGPTATTQEILDVLSEQHTPAVFFDTGIHAAQYPEAVKATVEAGHQLGNHTWDHPDLRTLDKDEAIEQIDDTYKELSAYGEVEFFRPPYGSYTDAMRLHAEEKNMKLALWTLDSKDFEATSTEQIVEQAMGVTAGGNVLLHDRPETAAALPLIINAYHEQGMCFGPLAASENVFFPVESPALTFKVEAVAP